MALLFDLLHTAEITPRNGRARHRSRRSHGFGADSRSPSGAQWARLDAVSEADALSALDKPAREFFRMSGIFLPQRL